MERIIKIVTGILLLTVLMILTACNTSTEYPHIGIDVVGEGEVITKSYEVTSDELAIKGIHVKQGGSTYQADVEFVGGEEKSVQITAQGSILEHITAERVGETFVIQGKNTENYVTESVKIVVRGTYEAVSLASARGTVSGTALTDGGTMGLSGASEIMISSLQKKKFAFELSGASNLKSTSSIVDELTCTLSGSSEFKTSTLISDSIDMNLSGASTFVGEMALIDSIKIDCSGASVIKLNGQGDVVKATLSGASAFHGKEFETRVAQFDLSGASIVKTRVSDTLTVSASGGSEVRYLGECQVVKKVLSGNSIITKE